MKYRVLLLDVDGTVLPIGPNTKPSRAVIDALQQAQQYVHVGFASGRSFAWLEELIQTIGMTGPSIANGGSQILMPNGDVLWEATISDDAVKNIVGAVTRETTLIVNDAGTEILNPTSTQFSAPLAIKIQELKIDVAQQYQRILEQIPGIAFHENASWKEGYVDLYITHENGTKQHAVEKLAEILGVHQAEIVGVGDGKNDIPLLRACGLGIAMGNAHDDLKRIAHDVVASVDEDGVAQVVEKYFLIQELKHVRSM